MSRCIKLQISSALPIVLAAITAFFAPSERPEGCDAIVAWLRLVSVAGRRLAVVAGPGMVLLLEGCGTVEEDGPKDADDDSAIGAPFTTLDFAWCRESKEECCVARGEVCVDL